MVRYRRNFVAGGTYFFTVTLVDRKSRALIDHVDALRAAVRDTRRAHPFSIDAIVVLPDHLHIVMTLPEGDADFPNRWRLIKRRFTDAVSRAGVPIARAPNGDYALWQRRFWEHTIQDDRDFERHVGYIHFNPVKHGLVARARLAVLVVSSLRAARIAPRGLGGRPRVVSDRVWRADGITRILLRSTQAQA